MGDAATGSTALVVVEDHDLAVKLAAEDNRTRELDRARGDVAMILSTDGFLSDSVILLVRLN